MYYISTFSAYNFLFPWYFIFHFFPFIKIFFSISILSLESFSLFPFSIFLFHFSISLELFFFKFPLSKHFLFLALFYYLHINLLFVFHLHEVHEHILFCLVKNLSKKIVLERTKTSVDECNKLIQLNFKLMKVMEILAQAPHVQLIFAAIRIKEVDTLVSPKQS